MKLKFKVTFREYVKLLFSLTYQRPIMKALVGVAVLLVLWIVVYYLHITDLPEPVIYQYLTLIFIVVVQPIVIFTTIRKTYRSSNHISEMLEMEILQKEIRITGESFYMEVKWEKMFKIVEKPNWFLIYQNEFSAIIIPKKNISPDEIGRFRDILKDCDNVTVELSHSRY